MAGVPEEELYKFIGESKPVQQEQDFEIWQENWQTFIFFEALSTQWKIISGMGGAQVIGLDYPAIETMMRIKNIPRKTQAPLFLQLQIMEREALDVMNKKPKDIE